MIDWMRAKRQASDQKSKKSWKSKKRKKSKKNHSQHKPSRRRTNNSHDPTNNHSSYHCSRTNSNKLKAEIQKLRVRHSPFNHCSLLIYLCVCMSCLLLP